jgi:hypothetical protein
MYEKNARYKTKYISFLKKASLYCTSEKEIKNKTSQTTTPMGIQRKTSGVQNKWFSLCYKFNRGGGGAGVQAKPRLNLPRPGKKIQD